jgi:hypothetical protein
MLLAVASCDGISEAFENLIMESIRMSGEATFHSFVYLRKAAEIAADAATKNLVGAIVTLTRLGCQNTGQTRRSNVS